MAGKIGDDIFGKHYNSRNKQEPENWKNKNIDPGKAYREFP